MGQDAGATRAIERVGRAWRFALLGVALGAVLVVASTGAAATSARSAASSAAQGKSATVLENAGLAGTWPSLDPLLGQAIAEWPYLDAIYGDLFEEGQHGKVVPDLAKSYKYANGGKTFVISLRKGVTFTDGTPFNAKAVAFNIKRDLDPQYACTCLGYFPVKSVATPNNYTVALHLKQPDYQLVEAFFGSAPNWIYSPTALKKMGTKAFGLKPVGAGPFQVVSNVPSSKLVLKANPNYWEKGKPYLDNLTFQVVGTDQSAYSALLTGQAQVYQGYRTYSNVDTVKQHVNVTALSPNGLGPFVIQLNTAIAPFNNQLAREAIYYATDPGAIAKALTGGQGHVVESPTWPGSLFYEAKVPGYRGYNPAKAQAIVKKLGGLKVDLGTIQTTIDMQIEEALQSQWQRAGIQVSLHHYPLTPLIQAFHSNKWQAMLQSTGGTDPALSKGLAFRFLSTAPFSGIHDKMLDQLAAKGIATSGVKAQTKVYDHIWNYIAQKAYAPFLFWLPFYALTTNGVSAPGLTSPLSDFQVYWQDLKVK